MEEEMERIKQIKQDFEEQNKQTLMEELQARNKQIEEAKAKFAKPADSVADDKVDLDNPEKEASEEKQLKKEQFKWSPEAEETLEDILI
mmetsp:Transcript_14886/g.25360  ORF Transcript_14886/g.25360 Transcript_14886/m.25360 type:complete len:89 (+) Transcript_14886:1123-1389(+)